MREPGRRGSVAAIVATVVAVTLSACGGSESDDASGGDPIPIGQVGNYSGAIPGLAGQGYGLQAWVRSVNDSGGIDGRQIELTTGDAKGDPAAEVSQVTQIATNEQVVAFAGMGLTTIAGSAPFLEQQGIPVIGGNTSDVAWAVNPDLYVPGAGLLGTYLSGFLTVPDGKESVGLVYCQESAGCTTVHTLMSDLGLTEANGGDLVYDAEVSLASPSFTAQCLAAQQAGVQTLAVAFDGTNLLRLAGDCAAQGFTPTYVFGGTIATDELAESGLMEGAQSGQAQAPWFLEDGEVGAHRAAMEQYFPDQEINSQTVSGWAAGLALGRALEIALEDDPGKTLTAADVRTALGQIQDETFNGLTPPVSFTDSGVQEQSNCAFSIVVVDGEWTQNGTDPVCPSDSIQPDLDAALEELAQG